MSYAPHNWAGLAHVGCVPRGIVTVGQILVCVKPSKFRLWYAVAYD
jgi:hypothetical protein